MENNKKDEAQKVNSEEIEKDETNEEEKKPEGSGIFTVDGKELPKIKGGYTLYHGGGSIGENNLK
jgi:hypothetical protein